MRFAGLALRRRKAFLKNLNWTEGELGEGLRCYRAREFFAAHEHWEMVWLHSEEPEKTFLQGLIQVAAAFHHLQRGNSRGTRSLLERAQRRLERYPDFYWEIDVSSLCKEITDWLRLLEAGSATHDRSYPQLHYGGRQGKPGARK